MIVGKKKKKKPKPYKFIEVQELNLMILMVPSSSEYSMILWDSSTDF